jgi:hypothetical protein
VLALGYVKSVSVPFAPVTPLPAFKVTFSSVTFGDDSMRPATLEPPATIASAASNSTFSIVNDDDTFAIVSGITPAPVCTFTLCDPGAYAHVPPPHEKPPYTVTAGALDPRLDTNTPNASVTTHASVGGAVSAWHSPPHKKNPVLHAMPHEPDAHVADPLPPSGLAHTVQLVPQCAGSSGLTHAPLHSS